MLAHSRHIEVLVNHGWDRLDFRAQLILNVEKIKAIFMCDHVDGNTKMTKATRATNAMQICLGRLGKIKIDHHIHSLNINATSKQIRAHQIATNTISKIMENPVAVRLRHARMNVKTGIAKLCNFLGKQLDTTGRIAKNNRLIDL